MATFDDRQNTALLVIDTQIDVVKDGYERDAVLGNIRALVDAARSAGTPVIWVQHSDPELKRGTPGWEIVPELDPRESEALVHKNYGDSFEATDLEAVLAAAEVGHLVVAGAESDACIRSTIHGAFTRGYDVTLVGDAHTAGDRSQWGAPPPEAVIAHMNLYWQFQSAPERTAAVAKTGDVAFGR
ncbi:isochorismatase family protein [Paeniglutamicibacter kerguelensis]|uniref:Nicotinamidase-related amidase n=1 Tax=Paeniglutamicibacter kerguelensis TaxID=254788 RepID=A0ABS4XB10_9MICC|nr:isochorismatase family protein [Paeniglutamicibacter kerguelensis]MBP2385665.1 nicotinamidase-related amidase [Paeniglutamicibacter kerguelensis]